MDSKNVMPKEGGIDHSLKLLSEGYQFITNRRYRFQENVFETRLLGGKAYCLTGSEAAELFYNESKFKREGAAPKPVEKTLFGEGGVQALDDAEHKHRKALFMEVMSREDLKTIRNLMNQYLKQAATEWSQYEEVVLYDETKKVITQVACDWVGIPLDANDLDHKTEMISDLFEKPAEIGLTHFRGWRSRSKLEEWVIEYVKAIRKGEFEVDSNKPLYKFTWHRDSNNELLDEDVVAVEVLNLIRPTVAVSIWTQFVMLGLHEHPEEAEKLKSRDESNLRSFIQEVRRYYPFFPFTAAVTRQTFTWKGYTFEEGTLTLLDLYGTNHHPDDWENPDRFSPTRFENWKESPFSFIPQGGGDYYKGHRCAGEWITIEILKEFTDFMVSEIDYTLPEQDLSFKLNEIPTLPESRVKITNVKIK
ncbi:cytochrome P450 [Halalkalibacillus halophilus]|uniref:cytochrome P450 n=1 Tax=Halalkalibacillus halophilus TaxID=392827 RepID=UPI0003F5F5D7|nr:cytochrome P450 [Halalkalibacillus halophilus]